MSDRVILKALEVRSRYRMLGPLVPRDTLVPDARALLDWFGVYFDTYPDKEHVEHSLLLSMIKTKAKLTQEQWLPLKVTVDRLAAYEDTQAVQGIVNNLLERDLAGRAGAIIDQYEQGAELDVVQQLKTLVQDTSRKVENSSAGEYIRDNIIDILTEESSDHGLKLPTNLLREHVGGLLGGALVGVAARVDKGKSSLLAAIAVHFAKQLPEYFGEDRPILWLNNEGNGKRIYPRLYSAALCKDNAELVQMGHDVIPAYEAVVGRLDRIRIKDIHGASLAQVEQIVEAMNPAVVIVDMMANIRTSAVQGGNKTDALEAVWQAFREMAVLHDFVGIGTSQISQEGDDQLFPMYGALKDSKTAVQGTLDVLLMLGALNDPNMAGLRGLSTPKNKFSVPGKPSHAQGEVAFDASRCQFTD